MVQERVRARGGGEPDRLSALPDCLLHNIISFLKARQAVQTCVLSTRWRHLWRSVPCLDVDLDDFRAETVAPDSNAADAGLAGADDDDAGLAGADADDDDAGLASDGSDSDDNRSDVDYDSSDLSSISSFSDDDGDNVKNKEWERFEDFIENLRVHCNIAQLESFSLHIDRRRAPPFADRQAAGCLRRAVKKYCLPNLAPHPNTLSCGSWLLKRLHLCYVRLDNSFVKHVNSVCRSLEDLKLEDCRCEIQSITSNSLKTLILKHCTWRNLSEIASPTLKTLVIDGGFNPYRCLLVILAPAVAYLHLAVNVGHFGGISLNEMSSLAKALIQLRCHRYDFCTSKLDGDQFKLLCSISNVTSLELSNVGRTVLGKKPTFQEFRNLRNLVLRKCDLRDDFRTMGFFLQSSPNLEKLTLRRCQFPEYYEQKKGTPQLNQASSFRGLDFMCENLKVEIIYKNGDDHQLIKLLLRASGNLLKSNIKLTKVT